MNVPRVLVVDDQIAVDPDKQGDLIKDTRSIQIAIDASDEAFSKKLRPDTVAGIAFCRGQEEKGHRVENAYSKVCEAVGKGWGERASFKWSLVLLDSMFVSGKLLNGVPEGQEGDKDFGERILGNLLDDFVGLPVALLTGKHQSELTSHGGRHVPKDGLTDKELVQALLKFGELSDQQARQLLQLPDDILAPSVAMREMFRQALQFAASEADVLLLGETGVGKEVFANYIHCHSARATGPFVPINVAALPSDVVESELFGHEAGAFTHAIKRKLGAFELADHGTLFLDEIGNMAPSVQEKVLRALETRTIKRVGGEEDIAVDFRLVSATLENLAEMARRGTFREDLYYRLDGISLVVPPLRERADEIVSLAQSFLNRFMVATGKRGIRFTDEALQTLRSYRFPGNVRELQKLVNKLVALKNNQSVIAAGDLTLRSEADSPDQAETQNNTELQARVRELEAECAVLRQKGSGSWLTLETVAKQLASLPIDVKESSLKGVWPEIEKAVEELLRRLGGAALYQTRKKRNNVPNATEAFIVLCDPSVSNQRARQMLNRLLERDGNASFEVADMIHLIKLWWPDVPESDLPTKEEQERLKLQKQKRVASAKDNKKRRQADRQPDP